MTTPTPPADNPPPDFDPMMDTPITRVKITEPWRTTMSAAILRIAVAVTLVVGIVSQWQGLQNERKNAAFARAVADRNIAFTDEIRRESECRSQRNADLTRVSSEIVGLTAKLFVQLAQRDPALADPANPIFADFDRLSKQRDTDDAAVARAIEECRER